MTRQRHFARYIPVTDGPGTAAVIDRQTDEPVVSGLDPDDATELARDWNRNLEQEK